MGAAGSQSQGGSAIGGKAGTRNPVYFFSHSLTPPNHRPAVSAMVNTAAAPPVSSVGSHRCVGTCTHKVACDSRGGVRALLASDPEAAPPPTPTPTEAHALALRVGRRIGQSWGGQDGGAYLLEGSSLRRLRPLKRWWRSRRATIRPELRRRLPHYRLRHGADVVREAICLEHALAHHDLLNEADGETGHRRAAVERLGALREANV